MKKYQNPKWFPSIEITLPITGIVVEFSEYLTTGQSRQLQRLLLRTDMPLKDIGAGNISGSKAEGFIDMQDKAFEFLFQRAHEIKEGVRVEISTPEPLKFLASLPQDDGNLVYEKVGDLMSGSKMSKDAKKN